MDIRIQGHKMAVTEGMKGHLNEKLVKYEKYAPRLVDAHVLLKKEKYIYEAEITLLAKDLRAFGFGKSADNIFSAIDQAAIKVEKQLKKYREKRKDHHKGRSSKSNAAGPPAPAADKKNFPALIPEDGYEAKPMSPEEASMQLRLVEDSFLVFQNAKTKKVNVVFKRDDGHHGLIDSIR